MSDLTEGSDADVPKSARGRDIQCFYLFPLFNFFQAKRIANREAKRKLDYAEEADDETAKAGKNLPTSKVTSRRGKMRNKNELEYTSDISVISVPSNLPVATGSLGQVSNSSSITVPVVSSGMLAFLFLFQFLNHSFPVDMESKYETMLKKISEDMIAFQSSIREKLEMLENRSLKLSSEQRLGIAERAETEASTNGHQAKPAQPSIPSTCLPPLGPRKASLTGNRSNPHLMMADSDDSSDSMLSSTKSHDGRTFYVINHNHFH